MQSRFGLAEVVPLVAVGLVWIGIEVVLAGADLQLWGGPDWRSLAYRIGGFRPGLLRGAPPDFAIQPGTMFLSYAFLHGGIWHLAGNLLALATLGPALLPRLGAGRVLLVLFVSTLAGGLAFALLSPDQALMVGASGGLFGLFGTLVVRARRRPWRAAADLAILNLGAWLLLGGALAWQAHLGGFAAGLVVGKALKPRRNGARP